MKARNQPARITLVALLTLVAALTLAAPAANSWPDRSIRIIAPAAGSPADIAARTIGEILSAKWRQPVIVENRPGADNILAVQALLESRDGHTFLFVTHSAVTVNPLLHAKLPYSPADLAPISLVVDDFLGIVSALATPANSLAELVTFARSKPGELNVYTVPGSPSLSWLALQKRAGISTTFVPYRTPSAALADLAEGRIHAAVIPLAFVRGALESKKIRLLAVTNASRSPVAPDAPTVAEAGFPEITFGGMLGLFGPKDMPLELRSRVAADVKSAVAAPEVAERLRGAGLAVRGSTPEEFLAVLDQQRAHWDAIARDHNVQPRQ